MPDSDNHYFRNKHSEDKIENEDAKIVVNQQIQQREALFASVWIVVF